MTTTQLFYLGGVALGVIVRTVGPWLLGVFGGLERFNWQYLRSATIGGLVASSGAFTIPDTDDPAITALSFAAGFGLGVTFQTGARHVETRVVLQKR